MNKIILLIKKEFWQVLRDKMMLRIIFIIPIIQLLVLGYAITTDIKNLDVMIDDQDHSRKSRELVNRFLHNEYFHVLFPEDQSVRSEEWIFRNKTSLVLKIPQHFGHDIEKGERPELSVLVDGQNSNTGTIALGYCNRIVLKFMQEILAENSFLNARLYSQVRFITLKSNIYYNPELKSVLFMIPGIISLLLTIITMLLTALAIVKERESGTLEQLLVTPIAPWQIILGKTIPFVMIGALEVTLAMTFGVLWFHIPVTGSLGVLALFTAVYILATLGLGILISTLVSTQQQALFFVWFLLVNFILLSGFFYPIENMPRWVQNVTLLDPLRYYITAIREIFLKGSGFQELRQEFVSLMITSLTVFTLAVLRFHKRMS